MYLLVVKYIKKISTQFIGENEEMRNESLKKFIYFYEVVATFLYWFE